MGLINVMRYHLIMEYFEDSKRSLHSVIHDLWLSHDLFDLHTVGIFFIQTIKMLLKMKSFFLSTSSATISNKTKIG